MSYCDDCLEKIGFGKSVEIKSLPFDTQKCHRGEPAIICLECLKKHGYVVCECCGNITPVFEHNDE